MSAPLCEAVRKLPGPPGERAAGVWVWVVGEE
jgi:hypothetical protein